MMRPLLLTALVVGLAACLVADVTQWAPDLKREYVECQTWRESIISRIESMNPDLVIVSGADHATLLRPDGTIYTDAQAAVAYEAGLARSLGRMASPTTHVALIGDTPTSGHDVPVCLSSKPGSILGCSTPVAQAISVPWLEATRAAALAAGATYIDPTYWVCSSDPCPPVIGDFMIYRDTHHITPEFALALAGRLGGELPGLGDAAAGGTAGTATSAAPGPTPGG